MELTKEQRERVESQIVEMIVSGLEKGDLKEENLKDIADFVLLKIDNIKNQNELIAFLSELSLRWPYLKPIEVAEKGTFKVKIEKEVADGVLTLVQSNKIEEALNLAKSVTNAS